jgi:soluble lytic murein transglycosylase-like protein
MFGQSNTMKRGTILFAVILTAVGVAPIARADYAVLRSGVRLHITGYEAAGDRVRLTVEGGTVEVAAGEIESIEPEDVFPSRPNVAPLPDGPYASLIRAAAEKHGIDENLIHRIILVESNFNPKAVSRKSALGLMQLLPQTAAQYSVRNVFDPAQNIDGGTRYMKDLLARYHGDLTLALAAYNAGPEMVQRYGGVPPFPETQNYVRRVTQPLKCNPNTDPHKCTQN